MGACEDRGFFSRSLLAGGDATPHRVGIIDADLIDHGTRFPNLALMKISGYYKDVVGSYVDLIDSYEKLDYSDYDAVFCSKVFTFSGYDPALLDQDNVVIGGTGFFSDGGNDLPTEIEHHKPDYELYLPYVRRRISEGIHQSYFSDYLDFSIGFATRGCFRKCAFCVNQKYDGVQFHSHIDEWLEPKRPYIYLWDDNIMAYGKWRDVFDELAETGKPFQFRQGLDVRLMTDEKAKVLASSKYHGEYIFAFDHIGDRKLIEKKLKVWRSHCNKGTKLYVLCAYDSQDTADIRNTLERVKILFKYGCLPYIMRYESYKESKYRGFYIQLARWCNQPNLLKKMSIRQFCEADQLRRKGVGDGAAMRALKLVEKDAPDIAKDYFDMRYEDQTYVKERAEKILGKKVACHA